MTDKTDSKEREAKAAQTWLRDRYGAYRGHFAWRELEEAFLAGRASLAANAVTDCARCGGSGEDPEGFYDQSRGDAGHTHDGPCRTCNGSGVAASAGSEPVATVFTMEALTPGGGVKYHATIHKPLPAGTKLYTHHSPPEGMVGGWTKASQQLPPCRDDQLYLGINTAGFAGVFNAVADIAGDVHCMYETPEETIDVMSSLDIWQPFAPPTTSAGSKGE